jgi:DNA-3-methyladenine glycosylase II
MPLSTATGAIAARAPFDFQQSIAFLGRFSPMAGEQILARGALVKALRIDGSTVVFRVEGDAGDAAPRLRYTVWSARPLDEATRRAVEERIGFFLGADDDVAGFYARAEGDPRIRPRIRRLHGLHHVKFLTPFENAVWAVLGQRTALPLARRAKRALIERFAEPLEVAGHLHWPFPEPRDLARAELAELTRLLHDERRARSVQAVAEAFSTRDERWLRAAPYGEVEAWLRGIYGIGEWSSAFILFRGLGRGDRLPFTPQLEVAARRVYGPEVSPPELRRLAAPYGPWQGYWALYLRAA